MIHSVGDIRGMYVETWRERGGVAFDSTRFRSWKQSMDAEFGMLCLSFDLDVRCIDPVKGICRERISLSYPS